MNDAFRMNCETEKRKKPYMHVAHFIYAHLCYYPNNSDGQDLSTLCL